MYTFLVNLPADELVLDLFHSPSSSYKEIFPAGQPFKSLYALYALRVFLNSTRRNNDGDVLLSGDASFLDLQSALKRAMKLIVDALSDDDVVERTASKDIEVMLFLQLIEFYQELLKGMCLCVDVENILMTNRAHVDS